MPDSPVEKNKKSVVEKTLDYIRNHLTDRLNVASIGSPIGKVKLLDVDDGTKNAYRARFRTGSFNAMQVIREQSAGLMLADLVALIASLDVVAPEIDR